LGAVLTSRSLLVCDDADDGALLWSALFLSALLLSTLADAAVLASCVDDGVTEALAPSAAFASLGAGDTSAAAGVALSLGRGMDVWTAVAEDLSEASTFSVGVCTVTFGCTIGDSGTASSCGSAGAAVGACTLINSRCTTGVATLTDIFRLTSGDGCAARGTARNSGAGGVAGTSAWRGAMLGIDEGLGADRVKAIVGFSTDCIAWAGTSGSASEAGGGMGWFPSTCGGRTASG
jgi:hypothetical protein